MRIPLAVKLAFGCAPLLAQAPASAAAPAPQISDIGFSYSLPAEWETVPEPTPPAPKVPYPTLEPVKKGDACIEVAFTAKHGTPASVVVTVALPFDCYGQTMTASDLPGFGSGAAEELKQTFEVAGDPVQSSYSLGSHTIWIERAKGTPKGHPENPYTFEMVCTVLKKGAVCWIAMAADDAGLRAFEQGAVSLDGEAATALVPASAFSVKPS